jgi:hypothetical protein
MKTLPLFEDLAEFYNGRNAVAERVETSKLQYMHIPTALDTVIETWVTQKFDVILTGNPGDGKTHLISILQGKGSLLSAYVEKDASQRDTESILQVWQRKRQENVPFVLAINHAPLRNLAAKAKVYPNLEHLVNIPEEIDNCVYYNTPLESKLQRTIVVDLSQREIITPTIVKGIADRLCKQITSTRCNDCPPRKCPVEYNAEALSSDKILHNLVAILTLVARRGFHTTMRDLIGLIAYILTGDKPCAVRWQPIKNEDGRVPTFEDYVYYNLLFKGRSRLFDAIRQTFDPANYSEPDSDAKLWAGAIRDGWLIPEPVVIAPSSLEELKILKRRYFFEHQHDTDKLLQHTLPTTEYEFGTLIKGEFDDPSQVESLIGLINNLYAPLPVHQRADQNYRLRLWNSHRYSVGNRPGYFAMRSIPSDDLTIYRPKANPQIAQAMEIRQDHVLLAVQDWEPGDPSLRIDWPIYQTLMSADYGSPIEVQPFHILRRLDLFLRSLGPEAGSSRHIENIEWSDHQHRTLVSIRINRTNQSYEGVRHP